jgi:hypothetical protein
MLLTLSAVRARRHSFHSQADSAASIPATRSKREKALCGCVVGVLCRIDLYVIKARLRRAALP